MQARYDNDSSQAESNAIRVQAFKAEEVGDYEYMYSTLAGDFFIDHFRNLETGGIHRVMNSQF